MTCSAITIKGTKCDNKIDITDLCSIHYGRKTSILQNNTRGIDKYHEIRGESKNIDKSLNQQYNDVCETLSLFGINNSLIKLILEYRTGHYADLSWIYCNYGQYSLTFDPNGLEIICCCPSCRSCLICCKEDTCDHKRKNIGNGSKHCIERGCSECVCEPSRLHGNYDCIG